MTLEEIIEEYGDLICGGIVMAVIFTIIAAGIDGGMVSRFLAGALDACAGG